MDLVSESVLFSIFDCLFLELSCLLKFLLTCLLFLYFSSYSSFLFNLVLDLLILPGN